jgi:hypothetical protein
VINGGYLVDASLISRLTWPDSSSGWSTKPRSKLVPCSPSQAVLLGRLAVIVGHYEVVDVDV